MQFLLDIIPILNIYNKFCFTTEALVRNANIYRVARSIYMSGFNIDHEEDKLLVNYAIGFLKQHAIKKQNEEQKRWQNQRTN